MTAYTAYAPPGATHPALESFTYAAIADTDAIKTSIATVVLGVTYTVFNGALGGTLNLPRNVTVTSSAAVGSYIIALPIVFTGTTVDAQGNSTAATESLTLTATGGNETISGSVPFATVTSIAIPAMTDTAGAFQFGVGDIIPASRIRQVRGGSDGNILVKYQSGRTDTIPTLTGERHDVLGCKIVSAGTTALPITIYL